VTASGAALVTPGVLPMSLSAQACLETKTAAKNCKPLPASTPTGNATHTLYEQVAGETRGMHVVALRQHICPNGTCPMVIEGLVLRYDGVHFTPQGARWFVNKLAPLLPDPGAARAQ
jgi:hypothetical protein